MENQELKKNIFEWLQKNSNEFIYNENYINKIIEITENYISADDKEHNDFWLEYFMYMNFINSRVKLVKDAWEKNFLNDRLKLVDMGVYQNIFFNSLLECAKRGIFEKNVIFEENNFYLGIDKLEKDISSCISMVLQSLYEKK